MIEPDQSMVIDFSKTPKNVQALYNELVDRHDHLREALFIRREAIKAQQRFEEPWDNSFFLRIRESILWFLTVEFYSRFLSDPSKKNNSKKCLHGLINMLEDPMNARKQHTIL